MAQAEEEPQSSVAHESRHMTDYWRPDDEVNNCQLCNKAFSLFTRKHHCRACGDIFCDDCSSKRMPVPERQIEMEERVCDTCYAKKKLGTMNSAKGSADGAAAGPEEEPHGGVEALTTTQLHQTLFFRLYNAKREYTDEEIAQALPVNYINIKEDGSRRTIQMRQHWVDRTNLNGLSEKQGQLMSVAEKAAWFYTTEVCYFAVNNALKNDDPNELPMFIPLIRMINNYIVNTRPPTRVVTYRGSHTINPTNFIGGQHYRFAQFVSLSLRFEAAQSFAQQAHMLRFDVPADCYNGAPLSLVSEFSQEQEILLPPYTACRFIEEEDSVYCFEVVPDNRRYEEEAEAPELYGPPATFTGAWHATRHNNYTADDIRASLQRIDPLYRACWDQAVEQLPRQSPPYNVVARLHTMQFPELQDIDRSTGQRYPNERQYASDRQPYCAVNYVLRENLDPRAWMPYIQTLRTYFLVNSGPNSTELVRSHRVLYRGTYWPDHWPPTLSEGEIVCFRSFSACSPDLAVAEDNLDEGKTLFVIHYPPDSRDITDFMRHSWKPEESEVLVFPYAAMRFVRASPHTTLTGVTVAELQTVGGLRDTVDARAA